MIEGFSRAFKRREKSIARAFMVYMLLSTCWLYEEVYPEKEDLVKASHLCQLLATYC